MEEELITFKTAKLAKEKSFTIGTSYCFQEYKDKVVEDYDLDMTYYNHREESNYNLYKIIERPTQSLLQRWLREKHKVYVYCLPKATPHNTIVWYNNFSVRKAKNRGEGYYETYEEALEEGLFEVLQLIKK